MKLPKVSAGIVSFAHLLGIQAKAEENDDKKRDDETDDEYAKRMEEDGDDDKKEKSKKAKKAEEDDDSDESAEDEDKEPKDKEKAKSIQLQERARCAAIFACDAAGTRPDMAAHLAFNTDMSSEAAIAMLAVSAAGSTPKSKLYDRMASVKTPNVGPSSVAGPAANSQQDNVAQILAAVEKVRPKN